MRPLRNLGTRPELLVDHQGNRVIDPTDRSQVGFASPLGNQRLVKALPLNESGTGPVQAVPYEALHDHNGYYIVDPDGNLIGFQGEWIHRIVYARWTEDTRRLT